MKEQPDGRSKCVEDRIALGEDGEVDKDTWNVLHDANEEKWATRTRTRLESDEIV